MDRRDEPSANDRGGGKGSVSRLLYQRIRRGLWILAVALLAMAVQEIVLRPGEDPLISLVHVLSLSALVALAAAMRRLHTRRQAVAVGILGAAVIVAATLAVAVSTGRETTSLIVLVALAMGVAAFFPWGWRPQALVAIMVGSAFPLEILVNHGEISITRSRELAGFFVVLGASILVARELESQRRLTEAEQRRRREREHELERQRSFLRQVVDINPDMLFVRDRAGRFTFANRALANAYGLAVDELLGKSDADLNPNTDEIERFRSADLEVMESGREISILEQAVTHLDGGERWLRVVKRPLADEDGAINQVLVVATEITEQKRAQAAVQASADVSSGLARVSEGIITSMNRPDLLERLCQLTAEAIGADTVQMWRLDEEGERFLPMAAWGEPEERWSVLRVLDVRVSQVAPLMEEADRQRATWFPIERFEPPLLRVGPGVKGVMWISLRRGDRATGAIIAKYIDAPEPAGGNAERLARGISHLASIALENARLHEELERANRLKSDFMATMSHELRTPLNVILGYTGLVLEGAMGEIDAEPAAALRRVNESALQLLDLINATLDVTRLESGVVPLDFAPVDLGEVLADIEARTREVRARKELAFSCDAADGFPAIVTDAAKLRIVLTNLVGNALKFTHQGAVHVAARADGEWIEISVADSGIGIEKDACEVIFEPFRQADAMVGARFGGVGLGLYIVKRLVDALGGDVRLESEVGRGTTFFVRLPRDARRRAPVPSAA